MGEIQLGRRSDHTSEELKEIALRAGSLIIDREGLRALTLRRVARDIGYTAGSLYKVFENLDDIIIEINCSTLDDLFERVSKPGNAGASKARLEELADRFLQFTSQNTNRWNTLFEHQLPGDRPLPEHYQKRVARLIHLIEDQIASYFSPDDESSREQSARVLWSSVYGISALETQNKLPANQSARALIHTLVETYLLGLEAPR